MNAISAARTIDEPGSLSETIAETAVAAGVLGCEMADIAGTIDDVRKLAQSQGERFLHVGRDVAAIVGANERIRSEAEQTASAARSTRDAVEASLQGAVSQIESGLAAVGSALDEAVQATNEISHVALQTRMVALNASIQAAHAGASGHSFAVVAGAVRELAEKIQRSSKLIAVKLADLTATVRTVANSDDGQQAAGSSRGLRGSVSDALGEFHARFDTIAQRIEGLAESAEQSVRDCSRINQSVEAMTTEVAALESSLAGAAKKSDYLLSVSERLIEVTAASGAQTDDTPFIECALSVAAELSDLLEAALAAGEIRLEDLFDADYQPVPGSNPAQFRTRFVALTDRLFMPIQESVLDWSERVTFCAAVDRNGYLPTHNRKYSMPPGADVAWNTANCRNRRLFQDRTGKAAGANTKPFLVQTYRRDMGGGNYAILKEVDAPIAVRRRHWGNVRLAFRPTRIGVAP